MAKKRTRRKPAEAVAESAAAGAGASDGSLNKPAFLDALTEVIAPKHLIGTSIGGQKIGKDRLVTVSGPKAYELCRAFGFEHAE